MGVPRSLVSLGLPALRAGIKRLKQPSNEGDGTQDQPGLIPDPEPRLTAREYMARQQRFSKPRKRS